MKKITQTELNEILASHKIWTDSYYTAGVKADLEGVDLSGMDLNHADLIYANLASADLKYANLSYANLSWAKLICADLSNVDLKNANINGVLFPMDYNCFYINFDDEQVLQFLFQALTIIQNSCKVSEKLKRTLLTEPIVNIANNFDKIAEYAYGTLTAYKKEN